MELGNYISELHPENISKLMVDFKNGCPGLGSRYNLMHLSSFFLRYFHLFYFFLTT